MLPHNYTMALKRKENTNAEVTEELRKAQDYQAMIMLYLQQGYIRKLPEDEMKQVPGWLLPHFTVIRPWRQTIKKTFPGSKLQNDLVDIPL